MNLHMWSARLFLHSPTCPIIFDFSYLSGALLPIAQHTAQWRLQAIT